MDSKEIRVGDWVRCKPESHKYEKEWTGRMGVAWRVKEIGERQLGSNALAYFHDDISNTPFYINRLVRDTFLNATQEALNEDK